MGSGRTITCAVDAFSASLMSMLKGVSRGVDKAVPKVVKAGAKKAKREVKSNAGSIGLHQGKTYARYVSGWSYRVRGSGRNVEAEIGNKTVPGLPHLIEKGHAKVGGGRVAGREHIAPAAEEAFDFTYHEMDKAIRRVL